MLGTYTGGTNESTEANPYSEIAASGNGSNTASYSNVLLGKMDGLYVMQGSAVTIIFRQYQHDTYYGLIEEVTAGMGLTLTKYEPDDIYGYNLSGVVNTPGDITIRWTKAFTQPTVTSTIHVVASSFVAPTAITLDSTSVQLPAGTTNYREVAKATISPDDVSNPWMDYEVVSGNIDISRSQGDGSLVMYIKAKSAEPDTSVVRIYSRSDPTVYATLTINAINIPLESAYITGPDEVTVSKTVTLWINKVPETSPTNSYNWRTDDVDLISIEDSSYAASIITGLSPGTATVYCDVTDVYGTTKTASHTIIVKGINLTSVSCPSTANVVVGSTIILTGPYLPTNANVTSLWWTLDSTADSRYVTLEANGTSATVTGKIAGTATLWFSATDGTNTMSSKCIVTVQAQNVPVQSISIEGLSSVHVNGVSTLSAVITPSNATNKQITWSIDSGSEYISIQQSGQIVGLALGTAVVRATAKDGSGVYATKTIMVSASFNVVLDANGGTFPNGRGIVNVFPPDGSYRLPDWSTVDRLGYRLSGWTGSVSGSKEMGSEQATDETWTAVWTADTRRYDTSILPWCIVRIWRSLTDYIEVGGDPDGAKFAQGGLPVVNVSENSAGSTTFSILNEYGATTQRSVLSEFCKLWSSGRTWGPIKLGHYVQILRVREDGMTEPMADGFISTISPDSETVRVEVTDRNGFLAKQGATLRRNYYGGSRDTSLFPAGYSNGLFADLSGMPAGGIIDGPVYWSVPETLSIASKGESYFLSLSIPSGSGLLFTWHLSQSGIYILGKVTFSIWRASFSGSPDTTFSAVLRSGTITKTVTKVIVMDYMAITDVSFDFGMTDLGDDFDIELYASGGGTSFRMKYQTGIAGSKLSLMGGDWESLYAPANDITTLIQGYNWARATGNMLGSNWIPTEIFGLTDITTSDLYTPSENRVRISYVMMTGQSTLDVIESMAWSLGFIPLIDSSELAASETQVDIFRTGGGYALDYMQKLTDISSSTGRMRSFRTRGYTTPVLAVGTRHIGADSGPGIRYGTDYVGGNGEVLNLSSFSPKVTMKNRPSMAVMRGTRSD